MPRQPRHKEIHEGTDDSDFSDAGSRSSLDHTFTLPRRSSRANKRGSFDSERSPSPDGLPLPRRPNRYTQHEWEEILLKRQNKAIEKAKKKNPGLTQNQADDVAERALKHHFFDKIHPLWLLCILVVAALVIAGIVIVVKRSQA